MNAPYVDNSYKWGGGGFLSTVGDLVHFGNCLLYARQIGDASNKTGWMLFFLAHKMMHVYEMNCILNCGYEIK